MPRGYKKGNLCHKWKGGKINALGYIKINKPDHPRADNWGYIFEHIFIVEKALGKFLPKDAVCHPFNEIKSDNSNRNLVLCENDKYHKLLHQRARALKLCGNANFEICQYCKQYDNPELMYCSKKNRYHKSCRNEHYRKLNIR
jgi:hypothetical protein